MELPVCNVATDKQGKELARHGTVSFPVACYYDDLCRSEVPWHWHEELEFMIVTKGSAVIAAGNQKYFLKEGDGFFVNSGILHAAWKGCQDSCLFHSVVFHARLIGGTIDSIYWKKYLHPLLSDVSLAAVKFDHLQEGYAEKINLIENAWQIYGKEKPGYEFLVREYLSQMLFFLTDCLQTGEVSVGEKEIRDEERMKTMIRYIQEHYAEEVSISQIAQSASISTSECLRCFHTVVSSTPIQFVKQYRIQCAAELLLSTSLKIIEIGMRCGFQDMSYFAKTFREIKGCTPLAYRRQRCAGEDKADG